MGNVGDMEIILLIAALAATPFGAALLADKPTQKRVARFVDIHWLQPLEEKVKPASLAPSVIPAEYGKLEPKDRNVQAHKKLAELWQDAFDWFAIENVAEVLRGAKHIRETRMEYVEPQRERVETIQACQKSSGNYFGYYALEIKATEALNEVMEDAKKLFPMSSDQAKALALSEKYGWELIDNDLIRLARKKQMPTFDYIALTSV